MRTVRELIARREVEARPKNPRFSTEYLTARRELLRGAMKPSNNCVGCLRDPNHQGEERVIAWRCPGCRPG